jgi:hypothetical protein
LDDIHLRKHVFQPFNWLLLAGYPRSWQNLCQFRKDTTLVEGCLCCPLVKWPTLTDGRGRSL